MPDAITTARRVLETRLAELDAEAAKIRTALAGLGSSRPRSRPATAPKPRRKRGSTRRSPRGQRRAELLAALENSPGATAAELGRQLGISTNQAYGLTQRLLKEKEIKKQGRGYRAA